MHTGHNSMACSISVTQQVLPKVPLRLQTFEEHQPGTLTVHPALLLPRA
jgi:hypothetical protein